MDILSTLRPLLPDLSVGALLGFCAGYAIKRVGKIALFVLGSLFILIQLLAYSGLLTVNWLRVQSLLTPWLQVGGQHLGAQLFKIIGANLPFGGAFLAGLLLGLRVR